MIYVKNTGRYALAYTYMNGTKESKIEFDRFRLYKDTGNVATTGVTMLDENTFKALKENKVFERALKEGVLVQVDEKEAMPSDKVKLLEQENAELRAKLAAEDKDKASEEEMKKLADENASLKAQLEALGKKDSKKDDKKETKNEDKQEEDSEGF